MGWRATFEDELFLAKKIVRRMEHMRKTPMARFRAFIFRALVGRAASSHKDVGLLGPDDSAYFVIRRSTLLVAVVDEQTKPSVFPMGSDTLEDLIQFFRSGRLREVEVIRGGQWRRADWLIKVILAKPEQAASWMISRTPGEGLQGRVDLDELDYKAVLDAVAERPDLVDFFARGQRDNAPVIAARLPEPFTEPESLPARVDARPRRRSAVFLHNSYYHFNVLSDGLRRRGWDVATVSLEPAESPQQQFFHGQDIALHHPDPEVMRTRTREFFRTVPERFEALHFYGQFQSSFFTSNYSARLTAEALPLDFLELRRHGVIIGYMPSGCVDGALQSSIRSLSGGVCSQCVWELRPDICNDARNGTWNHQIMALCDWVGLECDYATPERISRKTVYGPVVTTLDPDLWSPGLAIPDDKRLAREAGEILVYHGVGNYAARRANGRDIKGTGAAMAAIDRLIAEGHKIRLVFTEKTASSDMKYIQAQVDIVLDQLNYGRYGATAREALMLGKATICRLNPRQAHPLPDLQPILDVPIANADEESVYDVLKGLVLDPDRRARLGRDGRAFAIAWHGREACAARYEQVIDRIRMGLAPHDASLFPGTVTAPSSPLPASLLEQDHRP